jgi:hypothetical protein
MVEICEKRQSIADADSNSNSHKLKKTKLSNSSSVNSSSFEEVVCGRQNASDDDWQFIDTQNSSEKPSDSNAPLQPTIPLLPGTDSNQAAGSSEMIQSHAPSSNVHSTIRNLPPRRRCSDSSLIHMKKSNSININISSFDPSQDGSDIRKIKVSCRKCGKAKSKIRNEIMKLQDQLSNKSEEEISAKIKEFMDYLESKSQPSEMTETDDSSELMSQPPPNMSVNYEGVRNLSASHDDVGEDIFDENQGINVYASSSDADITHASQQQPSCSANNFPPKRFLSLGDINSR